MNSKQRQLISERHQYFKNEVNPAELLPHLTCLIQDDKEPIECKIKQEGPIRALDELLDRLKRRKNGFEQFVVALRHNNLDHVALLLDPMGKVERVFDATELDTSKFQVIGTAVDVKVIARIFDTTNGEERKTDYEKIVVKEFGKSTDENSKKIRKLFQKDMPQGVEFVKTKEMGHALNQFPRKNKNQKEIESESNRAVEDKQDKNEEKEKHEEGGAEVEKEKDASETEETKKEGESTKDGDKQTGSDDEASCASSSSESSEEISNTESCGGDSISAIFRLTNVDHAKQFWAMFESNELEKTLRKNLVLNTLIEKNIVEEHNESLKLKLEFLKEDYQDIVEFLENVESEQSLEATGNSLLSSRGLGDVEHPFDEDVVIKIPQVFLESQRESIHKRDLKLRNYQKELAGPALEGKNSVICAPTNSGKTFVAMEITKKHLEKHKKGNELPDLRGQIKGPKVVFIVSTQNLVLQQRTRFEEYLAAYSICDISGSNSTEIPLDFLLKTHDVVILTAQILLNALKKNNLKISDISLLIFDECHHTNKDHSYNKIMQNYMAMKYLSSKDGGKLPQILGLTASLGVGKSTESGKAKNHILQICANMDASCVSTVRDNTEELEKNVTGGVPKRRMEKVDQVANTFEKVITQIMGKIEKAAQKYYASPNGVPADRVGQQYRQWVEGLYKQAVSDANRDLVTFAQQLRRYHVSLIINDTVRIKDAMKYLDEFFDNMDKEKFEATDHKLLEMFQKAKQMIKSREDKDPVNPKLQKLKDLILGFHEEDKEKGRNGETKGILFTRTRDSTVGLQGWISETKELKDILKPKALVGAGDGEVGMTQGEQEAIIEEFKKGEVNILIATTVAEEGLDIGGCNFVIRYNMAGNEISSVQSRGRIRADKGNYVYLSDSRSRGLHREQLNQYREILMVSAVAEVQRIPHDEYMKKIESIQKKDVQNIKMKSILSAKKKRGELQSDDVTFYCRKCNKMACQLNQFRRLKDSYHVILDKTFVDEKVQLKPRKKSKKIDDILMETKVHCKYCGEDWGTTVKIDCCTWPCLKISAFAVEYPQGKRNMYKKWSEFLVEIPEATLAELLQNDESLDLDLDDMDFD